MNRREYVSQFPFSTEIGRGSADIDHFVFHDNGADVGTWRTNRRTTVGHGEVLDAEKAAAAREWCRRHPRPNSFAARVIAGQSSSRER